MNQIWQDYPSIQAELSAVTTLILKKTRIRNTDIADALAQMLNSGGKFLRPAYFLLFAQLGQLTDKKNKTEAIKLAASLEILHMATLIHDDVIDDSPTRRGISTIQATYGKDIAVYTGDFLFTIYFDLIAEVVDTSKFIKFNIHSMKKLLLGELDQMALRYNPNQSIRDYLRSVHGKTAELFALSCFEGAHFANCTLNTQRKAMLIGRHIGVAFQILDDILDYTTNPTQLHKPVLIDIQQGVYSLPLLLGIQANKDAFLPYLNEREAISPEHVQEVVKLIQKYDGVNQAQKYATRYTDKAINSIKTLPNCKARDELIQLTQQLLNRTY